MNPGDKVKLLPTNFTNKSERRRAEKVGFVGVYKEKSPFRGRDYAWVEINGMDKLISESCMEVVK